MFDLRAPTQRDDPRVLEQQQEVMSERAVDSSPRQATLKLEGLTVVGEAREANQLADSRR